MRKTSEFSQYSRKADAIAAVVTVVVLVCSLAYGYSPDMRRAMLSGPWEIVVQRGLGGSSMRFPVKVADENKVTKLDKVLRLMGSPIKIRLEKYLPDLKWETSAVEDVRGGVVVKLKVKGEDLNQDIWLSSADPSKRGISSRIGAVAVVAIDNPRELEKIARELIKPESIGVVSIWENDANKPLQRVAKLGETIALPKSGYELKCLEYMPHYSIDMKTKEVTNQSNRPVNPAVKIRLDDGNTTDEQWLWSKFPSSPHVRQKLPLRVEFADANLGGTAGRYVLLAADGAEPWVLYLRQDKKHLEKAKLKHAYPFAREAYSFSIEEVFGSALLDESAQNGSRILTNPAIVAAVVEDETEKEVVLEFNKPSHHKSESGTIVILYRRKVSGAVGPK